MSSLQYTPGLFDVPVYCLELKIKTVLLANVEIVCMLKIIIL